VIFLICFNQNNLIQIVKFHCNNIGSSDCKLISIMSELLCLGSIPEDYANII